MENRNVTSNVFPCKCEHSKRGLKKKKKILGLGLIISIRNSSAEAFSFALEQWGKIDGSTVLLLR